jgi:hypothetical protein
MHPLDAITRTTGSTMNNIFRELRLKQHDEDFEPRNECVPTGARPGSLEKLFVITERVRLGQPLWHKYDECVLATISEEFEKATFINKVFREKRQQRMARRRNGG